MGLEPSPGTEPMTPRRARSTSWTWKSLPVGSAPGATLLLALLAAIVTADSSLGLLLVDRRGGLDSLELWRPLTGHLVHGNSLHLLLNLSFKPGLIPHLKLEFKLILQRMIQTGTVKV